MLTFIQWLENQNLDDYNTEKDFAQKFLSDQVKLQDFPYFEDYRKTIAKEASLIKGKSLFIGGGPMPISAILLAQEHKSEVDVMEIFPEAIQIGQAVAGKLGLNNMKFIHSDAASFKGYNGYQTIVLALEAGDTDERKQVIFENLKTQINPQTIILIRGSNMTNENGQMFVNVEGYVDRYFQVVAKVPVFSNLSTTYLLHCQSCPVKSNCPNCPKEQPHQISSRSLESDTKVAQ